MNDELIDRVKRLKSWLSDAERTTIVAALQAQDQLTAELERAESARDGLRKGWAEDRLELEAAKAKLSAQEAEKPTLHVAGAYVLGGDWLEVHNDSQLAQAVREAVERSPLSECAVSLQPHSSTEAAQEAEARATTAQLRAALNGTLAVIREFGIQDADAWICEAIEAAKAAVEAKP